MFTFPGMLMALGGLYFLLGTTFMSWHSLVQIWPVFMAIAGVSIVPYAMMKRGSARAALLVPGIAIIVLAAVFLPFSLHLISLQFTHVVFMWWPILLIIVGIIFLLTYFIRKPRISDSDDDDGGTRSRYGTEE